MKLKKYLRGPFPGILRCSSCPNIFNLSEKESYIADIEIHRDKCIPCVNLILKKFWNTEPVDVFK